MSIFTLRSLCVTSRKEDKALCVSNEWDLVEHHEWETSHVAIRRCNVASNIECANGWLLTGNKERDVWMRGLWLEKKTCINLSVYMHTSYYECLSKVYMYITISVSQSDIFCKARRPYIVLCPDCFATWPLRCALCPSYLITYSSLPDTMPWDMWSL